MARLPLMGVQAVVQDYGKFVTQMGGMRTETGRTNSFMASLGKISLGGIVKGAGVAAASVAAIGIAAAGVGAAVGKVLWNIAESAAPLLDIEDAYNKLNTRAGTFADETIQIWQDASQGTIDNISLMTMYNEATRRLGETMTEQLPAALPLLKKAAEATGQDLTTFYKTLVNGIGRLRVAQLAQLGIEIDLEKMTEDYAKSKGIEADAVTEDVKRQLVLAESLKQLKGEYGDLLEAGLESDDVFERLRVGFKNTWDNVRVGIAKAVIPLAEMLESYAKVYLPGVTRWIMNNLIPAFSRAIKWIADKIPLAVIKMAYFVAWAKAKWNDLVGFVKNWLIPTFVKVRDWLSDKIGKAVAFLTPIWERLKTVWATVSTWLSTTFLNGWTAIKTWFETNWPIIKQNAETLWETVKLKWDEFKTWLETTFGPAWETLKTWWDTNWPIIRDTLAATWDAVKVKWDEFRAWYTDTFVPAFETKTAELGPKLTEVWAKVVDWYEVHLKPAFEAIGVWFETIKPLLLAVANLFSAVFGKSLENIGWVWRNIWKPALEGIWASIKDVFEALTGGQSIWDKWKENLEKIAPIVQNVADFINGVADAIRGIETPPEMTGNSPSPFEKTLHGIASELKSINRIGMPNVMGGPVRTAPANMAPSGGQTLSPAYNLTVNTNAPREPILADFRMMQSLARTR